MSPKKRQDRFFGAGSTPPPPGPDSGKRKAARPAGEESAQPSGSSSEFEIVDSEGRNAQASRAAPSPATSPTSSPRSPKSSRPAPPPPIEEAPPYIADASPRRRSSLGWAWLTIVVTLILAVGSYWFYEGFDGDPEKVRERFQAFSNRLVPAPRITPLPRTDDDEPQAVAAAVLESTDPLPVVGENSGSASRAESATPSPTATTPEGGAVAPSPAVGIALDGSISGLPPAPAGAPAGTLPTRQPPISPTARQAPPDDEGGWYRTSPSLALEGGADTQADPVTVQVASTPEPASAAPAPPPLVRASPTPQMTPFATRILDPDARLQAETNSPDANRGAESPVSSPAPSESGPPSVALPTELSTYRETPRPTPTPSPTPTPTPTPMRPSDSGMTQMSVGKVTAGTSLVDLGLVYSSRTLTAIHKNFAPPFGKRGASCIVSFLIRRDGTVYGSTVVKSSGSDGLDSAALRAIARSSPLGPLTDTVKDDAVRVQVSFEF